MQENCLYSFITLSCKKINSSCGVNDIEIPAETDRLEFDVDGEHADTISYVEISTKKGDRGLNSFPEDIFEIFPNVRGIVIESTVKSLTPIEWQNATNLEILNVRTNRIAEVNTFNGLNQLEELHLDHNQITIIRRGTFVGVAKLRNIVLYSNRIHTIEDGAFDTPELTNLNLDRNKLTMLSDSVFSNIPQLRAIYIDNNELTHIGRSLLSLQSVTYITLKDNHIEDIDLVEFSKLPKLSLLNLDNSGFSFGSTKNVSTVVDNMSLKALQLANNNLTNYIDLKQLRIFKALMYLRLSNNLYTSFHLNANDIKTLLPNLKDIGLKTAGLRCENLKTLANQLKHLKITLQWCCEPACIE